VIRERTTFGLVLCVALSACWSDDGGSEDDPFEHGLYCNDLDCKDWLTIEVMRRDAAVFTPGEYTFSLGEDQPRVVCEVPDQGEERCEGDTNIMDITLNPARDLFTLRFDTTPQTLYLEVMLDTALIGAEELVPDYRVITSEDPECYDTCTQGTDTMAVQGAGSGLR
jgi:hypothetical protein